MGRSSIPVKVENFSFLHVVHTDCGAHPISYPLGTGDKAAGLEASHSPQTSAGVKKTWIYTSTPPYDFMA
jgi:hypothetical protein